MQIRIGTRKSPLALRQAEEVRSKLLEAWPQAEVELVREHDPFQLSVGIGNGEEHPVVGDERTGWSCP